ncbi:MAG TPA: hypothetical protein VGC62_17400 [Pseudomonas sp.]|uniref:hypothetical protein n=1 Tax=Pseudomonas sp. TaxID=306 RepID=UPI002ED887FA
MNHTLTRVPEAYLGVWQRRLLTTQEGLHDDSTEVYWLQTQYLHADVRIPVPTPAVGAATLSACNQEQRQALSLQAGFAGLTEVNGDTCQWHRLIDFQPTGGPADIGRMTFETPDRVIEDGLDGSYHEIWERLPGSVGINDGLWLKAADGSARQGCLLVAGEYFLFAAERPVAQPWGGHLSTALELADPLEQQALLAFELSFGLIAQGWTITHSTLPGRTGQTLLHSTCDAISLSCIDDATLAQLGVYPPEAGWVSADPPPIVATGGR